jgi:hypothetical protein
MARRLVVTRGISMIKAMDALDKSVHNNDNVAPVYWANVSKEIEKGILKETKKGRTHVKVKLKSAYKAHCLEQLHEFGYTTEILDEDIENFQLLISWGKEKV